MPSVLSMIKDFRVLFPEVYLELIQSTPQEIKSLLHS
jgi:hypothetical protein